MKTDPMPAAPIKSREFYGNIDAYGEIRSAQAFKIAAYMAPHDARTLKRLRSYMRHHAKHAVRLLRASTGRAWNLAA